MGVIDASVLGRAPATLGWRRRRGWLDERFRSDVLGDEFGVLAEAIAGAFDLDDDGVVKKPIQQRGCDDGVSKDFPPFGKATVGSQDHGALLVAGIDELEEQIAAAGDHRQVSDLVESR